MKIILDIQDTHRTPFFMELLNSLDYIQVLAAVADKAKNKAIQDLAQAFDDVKQYEAGKKPLKLTKDLLHEL